MSLCRFFFIINVRYVGIYIIIRLCWASFDRQTWLYVIKDDIICIDYSHPRFGHHERFHFYIPEKNEARLCWLDLKCISCLLGHKLALPPLVLLLMLLLFATTFLSDWDEEEEVEEEKDEEEEEEGKDSIPQLTQDSSRVKNQVQGWIGFRRFIFHPYHWPREEKNWSIKCKQIHICIYIYIYVHIYIIYTHYRKICSSWNKNI